MCLCVSEAYHIFIYERQLPCLSYIHGLSCLVQRIMMFGVTEWMMPTDNQLIDTQLRTVVCSCVFAVVLNPGCIMELSGEL